MTTVPLESNNGEVFILRLAPPEPGPAWMRRAWDEFYRFGSNIPAFEALLGEQSSTMPAMELLSESATDSPARDPASDQAAVLRPRAADLTQGSSSEDPQADATRRPPQTASRSHLQAQRPYSARAAPARTPTALADAGRTGHASNRLIAYGFETKQPRHGVPLMNYGYTLCLSAEQTFPGASASEQTTFDNLVVDTGSNTSWLFGYDYRLGYLDSESSSELPADTSGLIRISQPRDHVVPGASSAIDLGWVTEHACRDRRATDRPLYVKHGFKSDIIEDPTSGSTHEVIAPTTGIAEALYTIYFQRALLVLPPEIDQSIQVFPVIRWGSEKPEKYKLSVTFRPGVALVVSPSLHRLPFNGVISLGLSKSQRLFEGRGVPKEMIPSFFSSIILHLNAWNSMRSPDTGERGSVLYFALRPHRERGASRLAVYKQNWISINRWPFPKEHHFWSQKIPVTLTGQANKQWIARLLSITLIGMRAGAMTQEFKWNFSSPDREAVANGVDVLLDTGSSLSYLPITFIRFLQQNVFATASNLVLLRQWGLSQDWIGKYPPYAIHKDDPFQLRSWHCVLTFVGESAHEVQVKVPCIPFVAAENHSLEGRVVPPGTLEGLIYPPRGGYLPNVPYILGLPFFQSAYVALHQLDDDLPYIRLAPQWPTEAEMSKYALPTA